MNTIKKKLFGVFSLVLILFITLGTIGLYEMKKINYNVDHIYNQQLNGINYIKEAEYYIVRVEKAEKSVLLAPTLEEKKEHSMHLEEFYSNGIIENLNKFKKISHTEDTVKVDSLINKINEVKKIQLDVISKSINGQTKEALALSNSTNDKFQQIEKITNEIAQDKLKEAKNDYDESLKIYNRDIKMVIGFVAVAFIIGLATSISIASSIISPINKSIEFAKKLAAGDLKNKMNLKLNNELGILINSLNHTGEKLKDIVSHIKFNSTEVTSGSNQLASAIEDTNSVMDEISQKILAITGNIQNIAFSVEEIDTNLQNIASSSNEVSTLTEKAKDDSISLKEYADKGMASVDIAVSSMEDIDNATREVKRSINDLDILSKKIEEIISMISSIAKQTNMLPLNAAIETARAGEHGKGFSVVAEEVRKLAEESAAAADKIESMILEVRSKTELAVNNITITELKVNEGTSVAKNTSSHIKTVISNVTSLVNELNLISKQVFNQAETSQKISKSMSSIVTNVQEVSSASQEISSNVESQVSVIAEISSTSEQLLTMTESLNNMVDYFKVK